jgi:hypothetical protein
MRNITTEHVRFNFNREDRGYIQPYRWIWRQRVWKWNWWDFIFTVVTCISGEWWSWITRGIKLFNHSQFFSIRQNTTRFFTTVGLHMISVFLSSDFNRCIISHHGFCFPILSSSTTMYHSRSPTFVLKYNNRFFLLIFTTCTQIQ